MIELNKPIILKDGTLVPAGVRLEFKNGTAKYQRKPVERALIPLQTIKGSGGPFLHAASALLLNDNRDFQKQIGRTYKDWAHVIAWGDYLIVYVWDTREIIDVIPGLHKGAKGGPVNRTLVNKKTGEKLEQTMGHRNWGWSKTIYEMLMWDQYKRHDNGLPLVTKNEEWAEIVESFNTRIEAKYSYEHL